MNNAFNMPLPLAVWSMHSDYDYNPDPNYISVTSLISPLKPLVLSRKHVVSADRDVAQMLPSALGSAIHGAIEAAWNSPKLKDTLLRLGYPNEVATRVVVNPENLVEGDIAVYMEQRHLKKIEGMIIGGKYDFVAEGILHDFKSTSVYAYLHKDAYREQQYKLQGSLYRWLSPDIITEDYMRILYIFTDWSAADAKRNPNYPPMRVSQLEIPLLSLEETEEWIVKKIRAFKTAMQSNTALPDCTKEELWESPTIYKYYSHPSSTKALKNFTDIKEAQAYLISKQKGLIKTIAGKPKRCGYCSVNTVCDQYKINLMNQEEN